MMLVATPLVAATAHAQRSFDLERFTPAPDTDGFLGLTGTRTPGPFRWNLGLFANYVRDPLVARDTRSGATRSIVGDRLASELFLEVGILGQFAIVVNAPIVAYQDGDAQFFDAGGPLATGAIRDPRIAVRMRMLGEDATAERQRHEGEGLALELAGTVPIGHERSFAGEGAPSLSATLLADFHLLDFGVGLGLGFRHRFAEPALLGAPLRNQLYGAIAIMGPTLFVDHLVAIVEADLTTDAEQPFGSESTTAAEWRIGARGVVSDLALTVAVGTGIAGGVGAPLVRGILGVTFLPRVHDRDHDGILDGDDACTSLPEDFDEHLDHDGCPEPDNDQDLVPDLDDRCPNEMAADGRDNDDDGCTDQIDDSDGDRLDDETDGCPAAPEDRDGFQDDDGCPEPDNDQDGILDGDDRCPTVAEDIDGVDDEDGCPDPDDDRDGVPDATDVCPREAEDADGHDDADGCPDPDDDHDGVLDAADRCPTEREKINGRTDDDGCPDAGRGRLTITGEPGGVAHSIEARLTFDRAGSPDRASSAMLAELALAIAADHGRGHTLSIGLPATATVPQHETMIEQVRRALETPSPTRAPLGAVRVVRGESVRAGRLIVQRDVPVAATSAAHAAEVEAAGAARAHHEAPPPPPIPPTLSPVAR